MIKVNDLEKTYKNGELTTTVLKDLSFEIKKKEFVAIMGRSGEGKSTLLYQIGLLDTPTGGTIFLDGEDTSKMGPKKRTRFRLDKLGFVFQDYALLPELTAAENVMVPLLMQGASQKEAFERAADVLGQVGLAERLKNTPSKLSGGEKQRVSIARAIANEPVILFADEPTASLDSKSAHGVLEIFSKLNKAGQTIVMVTHEKEFANYAERILTLKEGKLNSKKVTRRKGKK